MRLRWLVAVALVFGIPAFAGPILINNTGMNGGTPITAGQIDPNWILVGGNYSPYVTTGSPDSVPFPSWLPNDANSQWLSPQPTYNAVLSDAESYWIFRTTFTIDPGMDPASAQISGQWLADNQGADIYINGVIYSPQQTTPLNTFTTWTPFSVSSGFVSGLNTLEFIVLNIDAGTGGPAGLRVEMTGSVSEIPEPATFVLLGAGLLALGLAHRRRQRA